MQEKWSTTYTTQSEKICVRCDYKISSLTTLPNDIMLPERKMFDDPDKAEKYVKTAYALIFAEHEKIWKEQNKD